MFHFQASGVSVSEEVKIKYDEIKKKKCHRYCVFFIKDEKTIAVEKIGKCLSGSFSVGWAKTEKVILTDPDQEGKVGTL